MNQHRPKFITINFWDVSLEETFPREGFSICISESGKADFGISDTLKMNYIF
jgi:hypothetical protein